MPQPWMAFRAALTRFERSKVIPEIALRNTLGFAAALALATAIYSPSAGVIAGTGALNVSYSDSRDPYRRRAQRMLISAALCGLAVTLGSLSGHSNLSAVALATLWAFSSGMLVALGTTAGDLGVITLVTLVVYAARPLSPIEAVEAGLTAFGGAVLQMLISVAPWPVHPYEPERRIVANLYSGLARMARSPVPPSHAPPFSAQITEAQEALTALGGDRSVEGERLSMLLNQAERIRLSILMLARLAHRIKRYERGGGVSDAVHAVLGRAADALAAIAAGQPQPTVPLSFEPPVDAPSAFFAALVRDAGHQIDALGGQLRTAAGIVSPPPLSAPDREPWKLRFSGRMAKLQAHFSLQSAVFRHAVRLAICLGAGDALGRALSLQRTYWIPMTICIVLKPDFNTTFTRGVLRLVGTFAGLGLATVLFHFVHTGPVGDIALLGVFMFLLRWVGPANYGIFVTALSALVVLLAALTGVAPREVISARAVNTVVGGVLAMVAYAVWPTWEKTQVGTALAALLEAYQAYFRAVVAGLAGGAPKDIDALRMASRRARSNAEASVDRLAGEPGVTPETMRHLNAVLVSSHSFVHAVMAMESALYRTQAVPARPATLRFAGEVDATLAAATHCLRERKPLPRGLPDLRAAQKRIAGSELAPAERYELVNAETDRITTSVNTMMEHLAEYLSA